MCVTGFFPFKFLKLKPFLNVRNNPSKAEAPICETLSDFKFSEFFKFF